MSLLGYLVGVWATSIAHWPNLLQALEDARQRLVASEAALGAAEKALADLEVAIPKAEMEVKAQQDRGADLKARLQELQNATKVLSPSQMSPRSSFVVCKAVLHCLSFVRFQPPDWNGVFAAASRFSATSNFLCS